MASGRSPELRGHRIIRSALQIEPHTTVVRQALAIKDGWQLLGHDWLALAERVE